MKGFIPAAVAFIIAIGIGGGLLYSYAHRAPTLQLGAPSTALTYQQTLIPQKGSTYDLGTSTNTWRNLFVDQVCLSADCRTAWPTGGGGGTGFSTTSADYYLTATTTLPSITSLPNLTGYSPTSRLISTTYPIQGGGNLTADRTFTLAFSTSTSNTWGNTQTFTNLITGSISGNAGTATALAADGANCAAGNFPLGVDTAGAVQNCTDAWTEAENTAAAYAAQATTLTIAGTANQITSSAGAQSLAANRTWTLSLPQALQLPLSFTSTYGTTTYASSTVFTSTALYSTNATTTNLSVTASSTLATLYGAGLGTCNSGNVLTWSAGIFGCAADLTSAAAANPFTFSSTYATTSAATSSPVWLQNNLFASSTVYVGQGGAGSSTIQFGPTGFTWTLGYLGANNNFIISSSTALAVTPALTIDKNLLTTLGAGIFSQASSTIGGLLNAVNGANITSLSNLTNNGFVKTSGGTGALSVDTSTYLTSNQSITLSGAVTGSGSTAITTTFGNAAANTVLTNGTGGTATPTFTATSSLGLLASTSIQAQAPLAFNASTGIFSISTAGTWSGNAGTASALAANGTNCSAGNYPLGVDAAGNAENCTVTFAYPWTTLTNIFGTTTRATTTPEWFQTGLIASSTSYFNSISSLTSSTTNASTTAFSATTASIGGTATTSIDIAGLIRAPNLTLFNITGTANNCLQVNTNGVVSGTGAVCGGAGGGGGIADPFLHQANFGTTLATATTSPFWLQNYLFASSTLYGSGEFQASSTAPQLFLSDTTSNNGYAFRAVSGNLFLSTTTTTVVPMATSTFPVLVINNNGYIGVGSTSPWARFTLDRYSVNNAYASSSILVTEYAVATTTNKTIDARDGNSQLFQIGGAATTITLNGFLAGSQLTLHVCNPNATAGVITWATSPANLMQWTNSSTSPTQTTTPNKCDIYHFDGTAATSSGGPGLAGTSLSKIFGWIIPNF